MTGKRAAIVAARRASLIRSTIETIHAEGSLDVTVAQIAARAGVSAGLAHHYFGGKDQLVLATMRHLLATLRGSARAGWDRAETPRQRASALVAASFGPDQFDAETISAWLVFYVLAQKNPEAARLMRIYVRRLRTHFAVALAPLAGDRAGEVAEMAGALIDGVYLRHALRGQAPEPDAAIGLVERAIDGAIRGA